MILLFDKTERNKVVFFDKTETNNWLFFDKTERNIHIKISYTSDYNPFTRKCDKTSHFLLYQ
jgi:hypothetical protein